MQILSTRIALAALLTLMALNLAACGDGTGNGEVAAANDDGTAAIEAGSDGGGVNSEDSVTLVATEFAYDPSSVTVSAGAPVEVLLDNQGVVEHDVTLEEGESEVVHVAAGDTGSGTLTLDEGSYTFYCSVPGHREAGMEGTITAE